MTAFSPFDIIIIIILVGLTFRGGVLGITSQLTSIASWILSWFIAINYYSRISALLTMDDVWKKPISILVLFIASGLVIHICSNYLQKVISVSKVKEFDRQMGALLGFVKGVIICLIITFFCVILSETTRNAVSQSKSGRYLVLMINGIGNLMPDNENHRFFKNAIAKFNESANNSGMSTDSTTLTEEIKNVQDKLQSVMLSESEKKQALIDSKLSASNSSSRSNSPILTTFFSFFKTPQNDNIEKNSSTSSNSSVLDDILNLSNSSLNSTKTPKATPDASKPMFDLSNQLDNVFSSLSNKSPDRSEETLIESEKSSILPDKLEYPFEIDQSLKDENSAKTNSEKIITGSYRNSLLFPSEDTAPSF
ncbi:MAG: CvpA family protein [Planctomycetia bacterium]|nr:CvpA family protein [Planctomycetia bacterium]